MPGRLAYLGSAIFFEKDLWTSVFQFNFIHRNICWFFRPWWIENSPNWIICDKLKLFVILVSGIITFLNSMPKQVVIWNWIITLQEFFKGLLRKFLFILTSNILSRYPEKMKIKTNRNFKSKTCWKCFWNFKKFKILPEFNHAKG